MVSVLTLYLFMRVWHRVLCSVHFYLPIHVNNLGRNVANAGLNAYANGTTVYSSAASLAQVFKDLRNTFVVLNLVSNADKIKVSCRPAGSFTGTSSFTLQGNFWAASSLSLCFYQAGKYLIVFITFFGLVLAFYSKYKDRNGEKGFWECPAKLNQWFCTKIRIRFVLYSICFPCFSWRENYLFFSSILCMIYHSVAVSWHHTVVKGTVTVCQDTQVSSQIPQTCILG